MARKSCLAVFAALLVAHQVVTFVVGYAPTPRPRAGRVSGPGTAVRAFEGDAMAAMEVPMEIGQGVLGLGLLYAIMSMAEYIYHRYFQHLGLNKLGPVRTVRSTLSLSTFQGDGHVEHHRETLDDMTLDVELGREQVLDEDPFRGTSFPWEGSLKMYVGVMALAYPTLSFIGWAPQVILPVVSMAMLFHALLWNALHPNMHGLPDVPVDVGAPSFVLKGFRDTPLFEYLRKNHEGHHRAVGSHGNYNVCCPLVDQIVGTTVDPLTGTPQPKPLPDWVFPLCLLLITPLMPAMAVLCLVILVTYPPLPKATVK